MMLIRSSVLYFSFNVLSQVIIDIIHFDIIEGTNTLIYEQTVSCDVHMTDDANHYWSNRNDIIARVAK